MATDASFVEFVCEQAAFGPRLATRRMFGEYALYLDGKVVAFACGNQLYVKPTDAGRALAPQAQLAAFYPRGKPHLRLGEELDDRDLLRRLLLATHDALPAAKAKPERRPKAR